MRLRLPLHPGNLRLGLKERGGLPRWSRMASPGTVTVMWFFQKLARALRFFLRLVRARLSASSCAVEVRVELCSESSVASSSLDVAEKELRIAVTIDSELPVGRWSIVSGGFESWRSWRWWWWIVASL